MERRISDHWLLVIETKGAKDEYTSWQSEGENRFGLYWNGFMPLGIDLSRWHSEEDDTWIRTIGVIVWNRWFGLWRYDRPLDQIQADELFANTIGNLVSSLTEAEQNLIMIVLPMSCNGDSTDVEWFIVHEWKKEVTNDNIDEFRWAFLQWATGY